MSDILESWLQWRERIKLLNADGEEEPFTANHPAYPYAIAAYYAGWSAEKEQS